ncbi:3'-5' exonuclease [Adhaeribacter aquaticus]|uniref:3'-5' exonuclease n=1 Tax=Adhaeribacter aquaticus TaxID=299567 RepID=UPI00040EEF90|nr:3'-5' exonuclease [Adhaeribacter aquaticus]
MSLNNITILDFETTGLDPDKDRVIEIGAMRVIDGDVKMEFNCIVNPEGVKLSEYAAKVNNISEEQLANGTNQRLAMALLRNIIGDSVIIAHNAAFDLSFLHHSYNRLGGQPLTNPFLCTRTVAAFRYPFPHSLESLCSRMGIVNETAHRALSDVKATYQLLCKMREAAECAEFVNVMGFMKKYGAPGWVPTYATLRGY